jgi:replicative DNA helicase
VSAPQAIESEQSVLGALLLDPNSYDRIEWLPAEAFYRADHKAIYASIVSMVEAGRPVDALLVGDELRSKGQELGSYLGDLGANTPGSANIKRHAELVHERYLLRSVMGAAAEITSKAATHGVNPRALAEEAEASFLNILDTRKGGDEVSFARAIAEAMQAREAPEQSVIPTGFVNLDRMLKGGGLKPGQLVIVAGRSSMGKSALAQNIAEHCRKTVAYFTLEMTRAEVAERSIKYHESLVGIDEAVKRASAFPMLIDETPAITLGHLRLRARRIRRKHGLGLVVVDYLQLMKGDGENRTQEIGSLSRGLKAVAKEMQVPVIAVAQINRGVEQRNDKRPMLSDLRESGDIENDADIVLMVYRDDYYNPDSPAKGLAEVIVRKQRNGPVGTCAMRFNGETTRFHAYDGEIPKAAEQAKSGKVVMRDFKSRAAGECPL